MIVRSRSCDYEHAIQINEDVFKKVFIPKRLDEVYDAERDVDILLGRRAQQQNCEQVRTLSFGDFSFSFCMKKLQPSTLLAAVKAKAMTVMMMMMK